MRRILRRVGKSQAPLQSIESQLFRVPLRASGLERAVKATSITPSMLQHELSLALGGISTAAPDAEQISACTPHCWDPEDMFLHWSVQTALLLSSTDWQEVSIRLIPSSPRRDLLSTSNMDSLHTEGNAVARRGQEESLKPELTSSTVGGDVAVMVRAS
ncbi:hypothetical protein Q5P01_012539 [Channa striata]|uniref:Uncharacterized protein n=1 Tax=Channa striata TaxID=64152 RepID=A0AA88MSJ8_CHASR|nr:hypothetical protein Q5P01_012539 [Channa striata]